MAIDQSDSPAITITGMVDTPATFNFADLMPTPTPAEGAESGQVDNSDMFMTQSYSQHHNHCHGHDHDHDHDHDHQHNHNHIHNNPRNWGHAETVPHIPGPLPPGLDLNPPTNDGLLGWDHVESSWEDQVPATPDVGVDLTPPTNQALDSALRAAATAAAAAQNTMPPQQNGPSSRLPTSTSTGTDTSTADVRAIEQSAEMTARSVQQLSDIPEETHPSSQPFRAMGLDDQFMPDQQDGRRVVHHHHFHHHHHHHHYHHHHHHSHNHYHHEP
jgi:hypothetical protein